jgi:hypothetical protein
MKNLFSSFYIQKGIKCILFPKICHTPWLSWLEGITYIQANLETLNIFFNEEKSFTDSNVFERIKQYFKFDLNEHELFSM